MVKSVLVSVARWKVFPKYKLRKRWTKKFMVSCRTSTAVYLLACMVWLCSVLHLVFAESPCTDGQPNWDAMLQAHDEENRCNMGDTVRIDMSRCDQ